MRFFQYLASIALILLVVGLGAGFYLFSVFSRDLPDHAVLKDYRPPILSRVYAGDGRLLSTIAAEQRVFVPIASVPKRVINAFISAEDKDFYTHIGIDPEGIARAGLNYFRKVKEGKRAGGASTITQQVAKNFLLGDEYSFSRKIREAILAVRIERALSKNRILELYLNQIFLGNRSYGVAAAAQNYFAKALDELTIAEAAYLAALPKAPNNYHPVRNHDKATERRNWVIGRMLEDGRITAEEAKAAQAEPITMHTRDVEAMVTADYYAEEVRRDLIDRFGEQTVLEGGLVVRTSLDPALQSAATKALRDGLTDFDRRVRGYRGPVAHLKNMQNWRAELAAIAIPAGGEDWELAVVLRILADKVEIGLRDGHGAQIPWAEMRWARKELARGFGPAVNKPSDVLSVGDVVLAEALSDDRTRFALRQVPKVSGAIVAMNPHTGRVYAMTGGFSTKMSQFNRATQAQRQPGSSFKPFVYLAALDNGFTPSSLVMDAPFAYSQGPGLPLWRPENYSQQFYGPTPLRVGLEKSRNVMTVRLANKVGMNTIVDYAKKFGIADTMPTFLSFALGSKETTVLRLTTAYAMLDNGGKKISPTLIDRVQDRDGRTIWRRDATQCPTCQVSDDQTSNFVAPEISDTREQISDPRTVYQLVTMMQGVCERGTAAALRALGKPVAGKTGTTNDSKDVWFIGFTPDLVAGVFVGYDNPEPLGSHETGASIAVPVFESFMHAALKDQPATPFRVPPGLRQVRIDASTGRPAGEETKLAIWEAFLPGTEPGDAPPPILDGSAGEVGYVPPDQRVETPDGVNPEGSEPLMQGPNGAYPWPPTDDAANPGMIAPQTAQPGTYPASVNGAMQGMPDPRAIIQNSGTPPTPAPQPGGLY
ncbi:MAG: penicillin-binding protein 1A [Alphaproteobacteria bacterium]|nr:penicillin-binding protein 1A [Alphaproteobacteria bacterium]